MRIGDLLLRLVADDSGFAADVERKADAAGRAGEKTLGQRLGGVARTGLTAAGAAVGTFVASGIELFGGFQQRMNEVFTLLPDITEDAMGQMSQDVLAFSRETGRTTDEVVPALYQAISAGVPPDNVFDFLRTANKAAVAGAASTTDSVNLLSAVTKGYGDTSAAAVDKVADLAFQTVKLGQTTYPELAKSIGQVVPLAAALGVTQEELFGITSTLTGVTGNTSEVMTQQKAILTALIKANPKMAAGLKEIGFESGEAAVKSLGLKGTLDALTDATGGSTQQMGEMLGSQEALVATLAITGAQSDVATEKIAAMGDAAGGVDVAFERMDSGIAATGRKIFTTVESIAIGVGEKFQAIGPLLLALNQGGMLFGVSPAKLFGGLTGAITGRLIPTLLSPFRALGGFLEDISLGKRTGIAGAANKAGAFVGRTFSAAVAVATKIGDAIAGAFNALPGSAVVKNAATKAGTALGGTLGTALKLGLLAAAGLIILELWDSLQKQMAEREGQFESIGTSIGEQIAGGTREQLEQSKAALEKAIAEIGLADFLVGGPGGSSPAQKLQAELDRVNAAIAAFPPEAGATLAAGAPDVEAGAEKLAEGIPEAVGGAARAALNVAKDLGASIPLGIASEIRDKRSAITAALDQLKDDFKHRLGPTKEVALRIGQLFNRRLAKGLKDTDPVIKAQAEGTRALIENQLIETVLAGGKAGEKIQHELERKMHAKDPDVRAQAKRTKGLIDAALKDQPPTTPGEKIASDLARDITNATGLIGRRAYSLGVTIARSILAGVNGAGYQGGSSGSTAGGAGGAGQRRANEFAEGTWRVEGDQFAFIHDRELIVPAAPADAIRSGAAVLAGESAATAGSDGGDTFNLYLPDARHTDPWAVLDRVPRYAKQAKAATGGEGWRAA